MENGQSVAFTSSPQGQCLRVNGGPYDGYGGAGEESKHQGCQDKKLTHRVPIAVFRDCENRGLDVQRKR